MIRAFFIFLFLANAAHAGAVRLKDLVEFDGVRGNDLVGYGLVVGLNGTGDGLRNAPFTEEIMTNILERLGVNVNGEEFRPKERSGRSGDCNPTGVRPRRRSDRRDRFGDWRFRQPFRWHTDNDAIERR